VQKYEFSIKTRSGQFIERLSIMGQSQEDAERKLNQMYHHCEIMRCGSQQRTSTQSSGLAAIFMEKPALSER